MLKYASKYKWKEIKVVPNIKSAIKRVEVNKKKNEENKSIKSRLSTYIKKFKAEIKAGELENATALLNDVFAYLDSAAKDNVIHKNCADRKKAALAKLLDDAKKSA